MIRRGHADLSISQQCRLVRLSRSAFYYAPVGIDTATLALMKAIDRAFTRYPFFGSRQIAAYLRREGTIVGRHRVRRKHAPRAVLRQAFFSCAMTVSMMSGSHCSSIRNWRMPPSQVRTSARNSWRHSTPRVVKVTRLSSVPL